MVACVFMVNSRYADSWKVALWSWI